jgi:hypothetical protein
VKHFLYLTDTRLVSLFTKRGRIVARREFAVGGAGAAEFERYVAQMDDAPIHLILDVAEEDFRLDTVPHVGGGDREAVLSRKLAQIYRNTPYRHALIQGREEEGRKDDRVMYTAITNPELLRPWLEIVERLKLPLAGIHSAAVFSAVVLEELDLMFPHTLLVTFTPGEEMRQTFFRDREIKFSRLTPIDLEEGQTLGAMIAEETTRTWQYLDSLRHFSEQDRLEVCILVHPNDQPAVEPALHDAGPIQYRVLDMELVATKLGLKPPPLDSTAEEVMVHLFLMRRPENHFASPELRRYATLRSVGTTLNRVAALILLVAVGWGAWNLSRVFHENATDDQLAQQLRGINREYDEVSRSMPSFGVGGSTMRDAVTFYNVSIRPFPTLSDFLVPVSTVLQNYPGVRLNQLAWQATDDAKATPKVGATPPRLAPPVKAVGKAADLPAAGEEVANPPFAGGRYEVAMLEGFVRVPSNDFRGAVAEVERLAADIGRLDGFRADVVESPLDTNPTTALQGRHAEREAPAMETRFVLRVVREHRSPA